MGWCSNDYNFKAWFTTSSKCFYSTPQFCRSSWSHNKLLRIFVGPALLDITLDGLVGRRQPLKVWFQVKGETCLWKAAWIEVEEVSWRKQLHIHQFVLTRRFWVSNVCNCHGHHTEIMPLILITILDGFLIEEIASKSGKLLGQSSFRLIWRSVVERHRLVEVGMAGSKALQPLTCNLDINDMIPGWMDENSHVTSPSRGILTKLWGNWGNWLPCINIY